MEIIVYLCNQINIPLDLSQQQQFDNFNQQKDFFCNQKLYKKIDTQLTQLESGYMVVAAPFEELTNAGINYLAIEYPNGKMLYAFVTRITPAPNISHASIYYVKDVWQTRMFDWTLKPSMIEKQHFSGKSFTQCEQDVGVNNYVTFNKTQFSNLVRITDNDNDRWFIVIIACDILTSGGNEESPKIQSSKGGWVDGAFQSCDFLAFPQSSKEWNGKNLMGIADFLASLTFQPWITAQIQKIIMVPYSMIEFYNYYDFMVFREKTVIKLNSIDKNKGFSITVTEEIHTPYFYRTQAPLSYYDDILQMFRAPYTLMTLNCINGSSIQIDPGYFATFGTTGVMETCKITCQFIISDNPRCTLVPNDYKGESYNIDYSLVYDGFPTMTVTYDNGRIAFAQQANSYKAQMGAISANQSFVGQSANINASLLASQKNLQDYQRNTSIIGSGLSAVGSLFSLNIGGALGNAYNAAATAGQASYQNQIYRNQLAQNDLNAAMQKQNYANQASILTAARKDALLQGMGVASLAGGDMLAFSQNYDRYFPMFWISIKIAAPDEFSCIGQQFKMFGFNYPKFESPNLYGNAINGGKYNFVKLVSANLDGKLTTEESAEIKAILQNGVGIYHYPTLIGSYI